VFRIHRDARRMALGDVSFALSPASLFFRAMKAEAI